MALVPKRIEDATEAPAPETDIFGVKESDPEVGKSDTPPVDAMDADLGRLVTMLRVRRQDISESKRELFAFLGNVDDDFPDNISEVVAWLARNQDAMDIVELYRRRVLKVQQVETEIDQKHGIGDFFRE